MDSNLDQQSWWETASNREFEAFLDSVVYRPDPEEISEHKGFCAECEAELCRCCARCRSCDGCDAEDEYWDARVHNRISEEF